MPVPVPVVYGVRVKTKKPTDWTLAMQRDSRREVRVAGPLCAMVGGHTMLECKWATNEKRQNGGEKAKRGEIGGMGHFSTSTYQRSRARVNTNTSAAQSLPWWSRD